MKNGFTLVELLAIIVILSIIALVTVPTIIETLNTSKKELNETQINSIETAARSWGTTNISLTSTGPSASYVSLEELSNSGYLDDSEIKDLITSEDLEGEVCITVKTTDGNSLESDGSNFSQFVYKYNEEGCD